MHSTSCFHNVRIPSFGIGRITMSPLNLRNKRGNREYVRHPRTVVCVVHAINGRSGVDGKADRSQSTLRRDFANGAANESVSCGSDESSDPTPDNNQVRRVLEVVQSRQLRKAFRKRSHFAFSAWLLLQEDAVPKWRRFWKGKHALKTAFSDRFGRAVQKRAHQYRDTAAPPLRMEDRLREQIEFYFSDSNLSKDAYLKGIIAESEEGWVPLSKFLSFNKYALLHWLICRIKAITTEEGDIRAALEKSQFLVMNEDKLCVRRRQPYVEKEIPPSCQLRCGVSCRSFYIR